MSRLAIIEPKSLLGEAVREAVSSQQDLWSQIELFTADPDELGAVTEVAGRAALVQALDVEVLETFETVIFCSPEPDLKILGSLPSHCRVVCIDPETPVAETVPVVAGINSADATGVKRLLSPSPAVILLSHLIAPLRPLGNMSLVAHVLQPASARGNPGLDELIGQARSILSLSEERPEATFGAQLAFNLLPWGGSSASGAADLASILGIELEAQILLSQAGVFHCCTAGVFLQTADDPDVEELESLLLENPVIEKSPTPESLGPVAAAISDKILLGEITASPRKGYWLWCCMDNLSFSAVNALSIAQP